MGLRVFNPSVVVDYGRLGDLMVQPLTLDRGQKRFVFGNVWGGSRMLIRRTWGSGTTDRVGEKRGLDERKGIPDERRTGGTDLLRVGSGPPGVEGV